MGRAWGDFVRGELAIPEGTPPTGLEAAVWAALRPAATARWPGWASLHSRCGTCTNDGDGYWSRAALATARSPQGVPDHESVFVVFASLEEALSHYEAAGLEPRQVLNLRVGHPARPREAGASSRLAPG